MKRKLVRASLIALLTAALAGCGGGGSDGVNGTSGNNSTTPVTSPGIQVGALTSSQWADLQMQGQITDVTINSPPEVTFTLTDTHGNAIVGLENNYATPAGAALPTQKTVTATIAKLVSGTNGSPSQWVNYNVVTINTAKAYDPAKPTASFSDLRAPTTDSNGTLTYLGNGQYKYKFATDITAVQAYADAYTDSGDKKKADVGDVSYKPTLPHRVVIQISGAARGTGTNTADNLQVAPAVNLANPLNLVYDFVPATGAQLSPQRDIASIESCNSCHSKLAFHGGGRVDTRYCTVCHTNQRKFGQSAAELTTTTVKYDDGSSEIVPSWNKEPRKFPNGESMRDMTIMAHAIHAGEKLPVRAMPTDATTGKNTTSDYIDEVKFPQPLTNCTTCHTGDANAAHKTAEGDNWKTKPSRMACGACHNDVDFATGANHAGLGGIRTDDSACSTCHTADAISKVSHVSVDKTGSEGRGGYPLNTAKDTPTLGFEAGFGPAIPLASATNPPAGVYKLGFEISSVTVASNKATVKYRILKDGSPVTLQNSGYLIDGVDGTPSLYVTYGQKKDGVAAVADWTASISATVKDCRDQVVAKCTQTGPDGSGYYSATLATALPADAKLVTGMLGINYNGLVQLNAPGYPDGIRLREPAFAIKAASSTDARRIIVSAEKCNSCHNQLGVEPSFHSGARNNPQGCSAGGCHDQQKSTGHVGANYGYGGGWSLSTKNMVHGIHGASMRKVPFNYEATAKNHNGLGDIGYPGVLNNCEQCHVPGSYDFSATANAAAVPNLLWSTDANGNMPVPPLGTTVFGLSPWVAKFDSVFSSAGGADFRGDPLVSSPLTSTCFGCHDNDKSVLHMQQNGGRLLQRVSSITGAAAGTPGTSTTDRSGLTTNNTETCMVCHAPGKVADIKVVHGLK